MSLDSRLEELNEDLECAKASLENMIKMNTNETDLSFQIEAITENINTITKEMASIIDAMK